MVGPPIEVSGTRLTEHADVLADYDNVSSIHIYSLGPHEMKANCSLS
jgi:hypothetical protein